MRSRSRWLASTTALALASLLSSACSTGKAAGAPPDSGTDQNVVFKDVGAKDGLSQDQNQLTDSAPNPDAPEPDAYYWDKGTPDTLGPDTLAPDILSPDVLSPDILSPDILSPDLLSPDIGTVHPLCGAARVRLVELAIGTPDYIGIKNYGSTPVAIGGFELEMVGTSTIKHTIASRTLAPGATVYFVESNGGSLPNDVGISANIPFYNGPPNTTLPNACVLRDAAGKLLDYWAVGASAKNLPSGATFTPQSWPTNFSSTTTSLQRKSNTSVCPAFKVSDWGSGALSH
mgnify:CR=1 FL=1